jgi:hypothetical protein
VRHRGRLVSLVALALAAVPSVPASAQDLPNPTAPPPRGTEPVILHGSDFGDWSAPPNFTARLPLVDLQDCQTFDERCQRNHYAPPHADTGGTFGQGVPTERLLGYRWDAERSRWRQIPFQVDEVFARYLNNSASGFSFYSGEDQHTTYAHDREGFRWHGQDPDNPCLSRPESPPAFDPVKGLDANDEVAFMASDAGPAAPAGTRAPEGIEAVKRVTVSDPATPTAEPRYVYVMKAFAAGPDPAFDADNGYVSYRRDRNADVYEKSESSYEGYGNARRGIYCDEQGNVVMNPETGQPDIQRRRPRDRGTVRTSRYRFRYDGRWLMTQINISGDRGRSYGPDVIDRWKARAFQQDPSSNTPCCGYEEEDTNWGGSGTLLGERWGPVRVIRETWGADSGTNVVRRESFYRDEVRMKSWLRVHVIPPLDGIYAQWDFNSARMTKFFNSKLHREGRTEGVPVDGSNDEVFGNLDDPCNENYDANDTSAIDQGYRSAYQQFGLCTPPPDPFDHYHQSVDVFDPTLQEPNAALGWNETAGPHGTIVDRITAEVRDVTPGGVAQSLAAVPYYRDDSCFDDGTGTDPGPKLHLRSGDEPRTASDGSPRRCWTPADGTPDGSDRFYQGSIATHGLHLLFVIESDNARQTVPLNEIVSDWRLVMLSPVPGADPQNPPSRGAAFGQAFDQPLVPTASQSGEGVRPIPDRTRPRVRLRATVHRRHMRIHLRWSGSDRGGSGIDHYRLQVRKGRGRWRTLRSRTARRRHHFRPSPGASYTFRVQAVDGARNRSRWAYARGRIR